MAKLSKRKRAELKEKEARRAIAMEKAGKPYSKHNTKICCHFVGFGGGILPGHAFPTLLKISDEKCVCRNCRAEFPIEFIETMNKLTYAYAQAGCTTVMEARRNLIKNCHPVTYYYSAPNEICYIEKN